MALCEDRPQHQELHVLLFATSVRVLLRPTGLWTLKGCETGPPAYRPYPRRLESLTICRCNYKGSTFFPQLFKDPECWSGWSWSHDLPRDSPVLNQLSHRCAVNLALNLWVVEQNRAKESKNIASVLYFLVVLHSLPWTICHTIYWTWAQNVSDF